MHLLIRSLLPWFLGLAGASVLFAQDEPNLAIKPEPRPDQNYWHQTFSAQAKKGGIDVLFLGDSITQCWTYEGKELWARRYAPLKAANFGIGSDRTEHVLWRVQNGTLDGSSPKVVVLLIGTNNIKRDTAPQIAGGVAAILGEIRTRLPKTKILLLGLFPRAETPDDWRRLKVAEVNTHLAKLEDGKTVFFLDLGPKFLRPDGTLGKDVMHDFLHLTTTGYKIWSDGMEEKLGELMK
ncbi:MAG TPA: platelet-activating factor acetylhydrolase IB subunit [Rariglobus sp.]|nr:platelet-activating factor acetylhydrolase IB subunit [Rariglobus sp.]